MFIVTMCFLNFFAPSGATRSALNGAKNFSCRISINISRLSARDGCIYGPVKRVAQRYVVTTPRIVTPPSTRTRVGIR